MPRLVPVEQETPTKRLTPVNAAPGRAKKLVPVNPPVIASPNDIDAAVGAVSPQPTVLPSVRTTAPQGQAPQFDAGDALQKAQQGLATGQFTGEPSIPMPEIKDPYTQPAPSVSAPQSSPLTSEYINQTLAVGERFARQKFPEYDIVDTVQKSRLRDMALRMAGMPTSEELTQQQTESAIQQEQGRIASAMTSAGIGLGKGFASLDPSQYIPGVRQYSPGRMAREGFESLRPVGENPEYFWSNLIGGAFGSAIPFLAGGAVGMGAKGVTAMGMGMGAAEGADSAERSGATPLQAVGRTLGGAALGATEAIPIMRVFGRFRGALPAQTFNRIMGKYAGQPFVQGLAGAVEEMTQEIGQSAGEAALDTLILGEDFNPQVAESAVGGGSVGFVLNTIASAIGRGRARVRGQQAQQAQPVPEPPQTTVQGPQPVAPPQTTVQPQEAQTGKRLVPVEQTQQGQATATRPEASINLSSVTRPQRRQGTPEAESQEQLTFAVASYRDDADSAPLREWLSRNDPDYARLVEQFEQADLANDVDQMADVERRMEDIEVDTVLRVSPPDSLPQYEGTTDVEEARTPQAPTEAVQPPAQVRPVEDTPQREDGGQRVSAESTGEVGQRSEGRQPWEMTRKNPPQVASPTVIEPRIPVEVAPGLTVNGKGYAIPGIENLKVVVVPPFGNKAKGTASGWSVWVGSRLVYANTPRGAMDTADQAIRVATPKLKQIAREATRTDADEEVRRKLKSQLWELRLADLEGRITEDVHKKIVRRAIANKKPVPAEVLADYPDLQATQPATTGGSDFDEWQRSEGRQPWEMTSDERALEVERLREQFRTELATPLMSEGSLSPAQLGRMSQKQRAKYQRDAQTRMRVEARIRELRKSDDELAKDRQSAIRKKAKSELSQLSRRVKDLSRVGVSGKTGKIRPTFQRQIEQAQARIAEILAAHPDLKAKQQPVADRQPLTREQQAELSRTGEGQGDASTSEQLESYLASIRKEHREKSLKIGFNRERGYFVAAPESFSAPESWSRYYARGGEVRYTTPELTNITEQAKAAHPATLTRRGNRVYVSNAPESMEAALRAAGAKRMKDGRWIAGASKEAALRGVIDRPTQADPRGGVAEPRPEVESQPTEPSRAEPRPQASADETPSRPPSPLDRPASHPSPDSTTPPPTAQGAQKQPWQMTREEWLRVVDELRGRVTTYSDSNPKLDYAEAALRALESVRVHGSQTDKEITITHRQPGKQLSPEQIADTLSALRQYGFDARVHDGKVIATNWSGALRAQGHQRAVREAIAEGRDVPPEVLADYPDLAPRQDTPTPPDTKGEHATEGERSDARRKSIGKLNELARKHLQIFDEPLQDGMRSRLLGWVKGGDLPSRVIGDKSGRPLKTPPTSQRLQRMADRDGRVYSVTPITDDRDVTLGYAIVEGPEIEGTNHSLTNPQVWAWDRILGGNATHYFPSPPKSAATPEAKAGTPESFPTSHEGVGPAEQPKPTVVQPVARDNEAALRDVVEGRAESGEKAESPEAAAEKEAGREIDLTDAAEPFFAAQREIESKIMDIARRSKSRRGVLDMNEAVRFVSSSRSREAKNLIAQRKAINNVIVQLEDAAEASGKVPSSRVVELADLLQASRNIRITLPEPTAGRPGDSGVPKDVRVSGGKEDGLVSRIESARQSNDKKALRQIAQEQGVEVGPQDTAEVMAEKIQKALDDKPGTRRGEPGAVGSPVRAMPEQPLGKERKGFREVPRIPPAPIKGGEAKKLSEIIFDAGKRFGRAIKRAKTPGRLAGAYFPSSGRLTIKYAGDLDTAVHELHHYLDDQYQIVPELFTAKPNKKGVVQRRLTDTGKAMREELESFWQHGSVTQSGPRSRLDYKLGEALAEWGRAYIVNPDETTRQAPKLTAFVLNKLPRHAKESLNELSQEVRQWAGLPGIEKTLSNVQMKEPLTKLQAKIQETFRESGLVFETNWKDKASAAMLDSLAPVWRAIATARELRGIRTINPKSDPKVLLRNFAGFNDKFEDQLLHGPIDQKAWNDGKIQRAKGAGNLEWLYAPLDTSSMQALEQDQRLVVAQLISERIIERAEVMDKRSFNDIAKKIERYAERLKARIESGSVQNDDQAIELHTLLTGTLSKAKTGGGPFARKLGLLARELSDTPFGKLAQRELMRNAEHKQRLAGIGGGLQSDLGVAKETLAELDQLDPERRERINEGARRYRAWADAMILRPLRDTGRISEEQYNAIKEDNQFYVNMQRVMEGAELPVARTSSRRLGTSKKAIQKFKGSTRQIENPYVSLLSHAFLAQREADLNRAKVAFRNLLTTTRGMYQGKPVDLSSIGVKAKQGDDNTITIYVDGKQEHWQLEKGVYLAFQNWGEISGNTALETTVQFLPQLMRSAITHAPGFIARNAIRDTVNRAVISRVDSKPWDIARGFTAQELSDFHLAGGGQFGHYMSSQYEYYRRLRREMRALANDNSSLIILPGRIMRGYHAFAKSSELVNRMAEFRRAMAKAKAEGLDDVDAMLTAALESRDMLDFAVGGTFVRELNKYIPFANAAVQGLRRSVQAARENPHQFAIRWSMYALLPTLLAYAWNARDDESEEEYQQLPAYQRDFFWNFKIGPNLWARIPKPFELGVMASGAERLIDAIRGREDAFEGFGGSLAKSFLPIDESAAAGPLRVPVEMIANYDMFMGRDIIPRHETDIPVKYRKGARNASRIGKVVQSMSGDRIDPRMIDHFIGSQFGELGRAGLRVADLGRDDKHTDHTRDMNMFVGLLASAPAGSSRNVRRAFELAGELRQGGSRPIKDLVKSLKDHREAGTQAEKDAKAREVRELAGKVAGWLEKQRPRVEARMEAQAR